MSRETRSRIIAVGSAVLLTDAILGMTLAVNHRHTTVAGSADDQWEESNVRFLLMACLVGLMGILVGLSPEGYDRRPTLAYLFAITMLSMYINIGMVHRRTLAAYRCEVMATNDSRSRERHSVPERASGDRIESFFIMFGISCTVAPSFSMEPLFTRFTNSNTWCYPTELELGMKSLLPAKFRQTATTKLFASFQVNKPKLIKQSNLCCLDFIGPS